MSRARLFAVPVALIASVLFVTFYRQFYDKAWKPKQIVLITIDTLRADRLGAYGYTARPTSPNIDALAAQSVVFDHAYAAAPWTIPSLAALHTGRYPIDVGAYTNADAITAEATTLAQLFQQQGVATATFNTHALLVSERTGFRRGFDTVVPNAVVPLQEGEHKASFAPNEPALMEWIDAHAQQPFFLWIHDMGPHLPLTAGNPHLSEPGWTRYDAEVRGSDDLVGRVLRRLAAYKLGDRLMIIFTADHGEAFGDEHGLTGHQDVMYDEVLRVPLMIAAPIFDPKRVDATVELVDLFPTIAGLTGMPLPPGLRGESLAPLLRGEQTQRHKPYAFHMRFFFEPDNHHWLAVRDREWKLLAKMTDHGHDGPPAWHVGDPDTYFELYRPGDDPQEQHDLFEQQPAEVQRLSGLLAEWTEALTDKPDRAAVDAATHEHLRALGYE